MDISEVPDIPIPYPGLAATDEPAILSTNEPDSRDGSRRKIAGLTHQQFHELYTDVTDEAARRRTRPSSNKAPFLPPRKEFLPERNQARRDLGTLPQARFNGLSSDVFYELSERFPGMKQPEPFSPSIHSDEGSSDGGTSGSDDESFDDSGNPWDRVPTEQASTLAKFGIDLPLDLDELSRDDMIPILDRIYADLNSQSPESTRYTEILKLLQDLSYHFRALPTSFQLGEIVFGRKDVIGRGGEAIVYRGSMKGQVVVVREILIAPREWNRPLGRKVTQLILRQLVHREALTHAQLAHPNILPFLGVYREEANSPPMVVLPFVESGSLQDLIDYKPMSSEGFERILVGTAKGVLYLHSRQPPIVHGDLHPGNILMNELGEPILCDFGLSRIRHEVTRTRTMIFEGGRFRFLAPELSSGRTENFRTSRESDIFALAMTFLVAWTGKPPFSEIRNERKVASQIQKGQRPKRPPSAGPTLLPDSDTFWALLEGMWVQEAAGRLSASTVLSTLTDMFASMAASASSSNSISASDATDSDPNNESMERFTTISIPLPGIGSISEIIIWGKRYRFRDGENTAYEVHDSD
ncbi:kinase-like protein [Clavulina sp. PMI_390]|nr:kinase-like protein [Clavulina sp. PMI_390]